MDWKHYQTVRQFTPPPPPTKTKVFNETAKGQVAKLRTAAATSKP